MYSRSAVEECFVPGRFESVEEVTSAYFEQPIRQLGGRERNFGVLAVRAFSASVGYLVALFQVLLLLRRCGRSRDVAARVSHSDIQSA